MNGSVWSRVDCDGGVDRAVVMWFADGLGVFGAPRERLS